MDTFLTAAAFIVLIAAAAYVIHRLNIEHADRIARRSAAPGPLGAAQLLRSATAQEASATAPATPSTDGHAPTFLASGCEPANAATYAAPSAPAALPPAARRHCTAAAVPAAASTAPPS